MSLKRLLRETEIIKEIFDWLNKHLILNERRESVGLDTTHDAFHGAYSAFNTFRKFLLKSIGGRFPPHADKKLLHDHWYWGDESEFNSETHKGLLEFFRHSDCDGEISPVMCKLIADEMESILPHVEKLAETEEAYGHILRDGGYVEVAKRFIEGCRLAHELNEPLEFR